MAPSKPKRLTPLAWAATTGLLALCITSLAPITTVTAAVMGYSNAMNLARKMVGVPPLTWSKDLALKAKTLVYDQIGDCTFSASLSQLGLGGAQAILTGQKLLPINVVKAFLVGKQYYNHDNSSCAPTKDGFCETYTQVIWGNTKFVGCFGKRCVRATFQSIAICLFDPAGNQPGQKPY